MGIAARVQMGLFLIAGALVGCGGQPEAEPPISTDGDIEEVAVLEEEAADVVEPTPENLPTIAEIASSDARLTTLFQLVEAAGMGPDLADSAGMLTVFAPTNEAFAALPTETVPMLMLPENQAQLRAILDYHIVADRAVAAELAGQAVVVTTRHGAQLGIDATASIVQVGEAVVTTPDLLASNGVVHIIDAVLLPPAEE